VTAQAYEERLLNLHHRVQLWFASVARVQALIEGFGVSATQLANEIDSSGAACLAAVLTEEWLQAAQECVKSYLPTDGRHELFIEDPGSDDYAFVHRLVIDPRLESLLDTLAKTAYPNLDPERKEIECAIRILLGPDKPGNPLWFHYDRSVVTMVVPIVIPNVGSRVSGELILCPNRRPYRRFVLTNIIEKFVTQNDLYRRKFVNKLDDEADARVIPLEPGNAYLFWGYRTYHATFPCAQDALRVTLVLHYGNVHAGNRMLVAAQRLRRRVRQLGRKLDESPG
jgi:hypothetical protein